MVCKNVVDLTGEYFLLVGIKRARILHLLLCTNFPKILFLEICLHQQKELKRARWDIRTKRCLLTRAAKESCASFVVFQSSSGFM